MAESFGKLDVLFVNAGVAKFMPADASDEALYDAIFDVNVKGAFFTIQKALPILNDGASVIVNTSINASMGMAGSVFYGASKAAMRNVVRTLARELAPRGIRGERHSARPNRDADLRQDRHVPGRHGGDRQEPAVAHPARPLRPGVGDRPDPRCSWPGPTPPSSPARRSSSTAAGSAPADRRGARADGAAGEPAPPRAMTAVS